MEDADGGRMVLMEELLAIELWEGVFSWLTSARDLCAVACVCRLAHALVGQGGGPQSRHLWRALALRRWPEDDSCVKTPRDFHNTLRHRVRYCLPEYGRAVVDLSTTSLVKYPTSQPRQPDAGALDDLRSGSLEDVLRYIYQQPSFMPDLDVVLHNYTAQFTDEEMLDATVKASFPSSTQSPSPEWWSVWRHSLHASKTVFALLKWVKASPHFGKSCDDALERMVAHLLAASPLPFLSAADLQRLVVAAEKRIRLSCLQSQTPKACEQPKAAVVAPAPLQLIHTAGDELAAELIHHLLRTTPERLAAVLTMRAWDSFASITFTELSNQAWAKKSKREKAPNVVRHIEEANQLAAVVSASVLVGGDCANRSAEERATVIQHWIRVAEAARRLNNFATVMAVMAGLNDASCVRLKLTWEAVRASDEVSQTYDALVYRSKKALRYRQSLVSTALPCLPHLGFILTDLTFICDGQEAQWQGPGVVPFKKWRLCNDVLTELGRCQRVPYRLDEQAEVVGHLMQSELFRPADSELYARSCALEPRNTK